MRLGAPVSPSSPDPHAWVAAVRADGYRAAYCPVGPEADDATVRAFAEAAQKADIVIAEVGAWCNPLSPDETVRKEALEQCKADLELAERIGARCCVNIAGSRGAKWDGPSPLDLTDETFEMIVGMVRDILDAVHPKRSFYTLETMPWMYPDSTESYLRLIEAIDRPGFAVHFDPVNLICSPQRYFSNAAVMCEFIEKLGPHIRSCHAKDIILGDSLTTHLDEVRPGLGQLDFPALLRALDALDPDLPLMLEHLPQGSEYDQAAAYVRRVAEQEGIRL